MDTHKTRVLTDALIASTPLLPDTDEPSTDCTSLTAQVNGAEIHARVYETGAPRVELAVWDLDPRGRYVTTLRSEVTLSFGVTPEMTVTVTQAVLAAI